MKIYLVGGAVRDKLLGLTPKDLDYVVVGATEQQMLDRGFTKVGASFPVFHHPVTNEEYALARKERKVGVGYNGFEVVFDPSVTLEEDLSRRDLTINAMAIDCNTNQLVDPFNGQDDLRFGILRHVSEAFAEDPIRVLRTARFAARYPFSIDARTLLLMRQIVHELNHVPQERIWAEFEKGLQEVHPVLMFDVLSACGAFEVDALKCYGGYDKHCMGRITSDTPLHARFAMCCQLFDPQDWEHHKIPTHLSRVVTAFDRVIDDLSIYQVLSPYKRIQMLNSVRAFSSPDLLDSVIDCWTLLKGRGIDVQPVIDLIRTDLAAAKSVDAAALAQQTPVANIKLVIDQARARAIS